MLEFFLFVFGFLLLLFVSLFLLLFVLLLFVLFLLLLVLCLLLLSFLLDVVVILFQLFADLLLGFFGLLVRILLLSICFLRLILFHFKFFLKLGLLVFNILLFFFFVTFRLFFRLTFTFLVVLLLTVSNSRADCLLRINRLLLGSFGCSKCVFGKFLLCLSLNLGLLCNFASLKPFLRFLDLSLQFIGESLIGSIRCARRRSGSRRSRRGCWRLLLCWFSWRLLLGRIRLLCGVRVWLLWCGLLGIWIGLGGRLLSIGIRLRRRLCVVLLGP